MNAPARKWLVLTMLAIASGWMLLLAWVAAKIWEAWQDATSRYWTTSASVILIYGILTLVLVWLVRVMLVIKKQRLSRETAANFLTSPLAPVFLWAFDFSIRGSAHWVTPPLLLIGAIAMDVVLRGWLVSRVLTHLSSARDLERKRQG